MSRFARCVSVVPLVLSLIGIGVGCSYTAPGRAADLASLRAAAQAGRDPGAAPGTAGAGFERKTPPAAPVARFPTGIAVARLQDPYYRSETVQTWGHGAYTVVLTRDVETDEQVGSLARLPLVEGIAPVNRLLLPRELSSQEDLMAVARRMNADMLLIYTFDSVFETRDKAAALTAISLGIFPTKNVRLITTASAVLMDSNTGYIYGVAEATARADEASSAWTTSSTVDATRLATERKAFDELVKRLAQAWMGVARTYGGAAMPTTRPVGQSHHSTPSM